MNEKKALENRQQPKLRVAEVNTSFCIGWYYNYRKGKKEQCINRGECQLYRNFAKSNFDYSQNTIDSDFRYIKEFRTCKKYVDNPIICDFCESLAIPGRTHCEKCACLRTV